MNGTGQPLGIVSTVAYANKVKTLGRYKNSAIFNPVLTKNNIKDITGLLNMSGGTDSTQYTLRQMYHQFVDTPILNGNSIYFQYYVSVNFNCGVLENFYNASNTADHSHGISIQIYETNIDKN